MNAIGAAVERLARAHRVVDSDTPEIHGRAAYKRREATVPVRIGGDAR